jgi:NTE family protein
MLRALADRGIKPDLLVGCSVGALNAAAIAADPTSDGVARLSELWCALRGTDVFGARGMPGPWQLVRRARSIYGNDRLQKLIEEWLPFRRFEDASVPLQVVATSLRSGLARWFSQGPVLEPLLASTALPAILPPITIDGEPFIDGGVVDNVPIARAIELGAKRIFVLHVGNFDRPRPEPRRPLDVLVQAFSIARGHRFRIDSAAPNGVELITLPGVDPGSLRYNDFGQSFRLVQAGRATATEFLDALPSTTKVS